jgi:hypothetical protein
MSKVLGSGYQSCFQVCPARYGNPGQPRAFQRRLKNSSRKGRQGRNDIEVFWLQSLSERKADGGGVAGNKRVKSKELKTDQNISKFLS